MKMQQSKKVMWFLSNHIPSAFELGTKAKENDINPFETNTNEWYSYNRGYNNMIMNKYEEYK
jgi:hypothetical protein